MFEDDYPGACLSCGFLALKVPGTDGLFELEGGHRASGGFNNHGKLICFRGQYPLHQEVTEAERRIRASGTFIPRDEVDGPRYAAVREVLQRGDRNCSRWYAYVENLSPKDHFDDWRMMEIEQLRIGHSKMLAELEQRASETALETLQEQAKVAAEHAKTAAALLTLSESANAQTDRFNRWISFLTVASIVLAISSFVGSILAPNGISGISLAGPQADGSSQVTSGTPSPTPFPNP